MLRPKILLCVKVFHWCREVRANTVQAFGLWPSYKNRLLTLFSKHLASCMAQERDDGDLLDAFPKECHAYVIPDGHTAQFRLESNGQSRHKSA